MSGMNRPIWNIVFSPPLLSDFLFLAMILESSLV